MTVDLAASRSRAPELYGAVPLSAERLAAVQRHLLDGLYDDEPRRAVVARLAELAEAESILFGRDGEVEAETAKTLPEAELWRALSSCPELPREVSAEGWRAYAVPLASADGSRAGWLAVVRRGSPSGPLARQAALCAAPLLAAARRLGDAARRQEGAIRRGLLEKLLRLGPVRPGDSEILAARVASFGLRCEAGLRVVCARPLRPQGDGAVSAHLDECLRETLERLAVPHLATTRAGAAVALVQAPVTRLKVPLAELTASGAGALAGIGREVGEFAEVPESLRDAELALDRLARRGTGARTLAFEQLDLGSLVASEALTGSVGARVREVTAMLRADPLAREALVAFFDHGQSVPAAARALFLHPNSLRYRLGKVERRLASSLKDPATIATLYISLAAEARDGALGALGSGGR